MQGTVRKSMAEQLSYEESYTGRLRQAAGDMRLIIPAVRAIILDKQGKILLIRRSDDGRWAIPAGAIELGESISDCLKREVKEETGLDVIEAEPLAINSEPRFAYTDMYNHDFQMFVITFIVRKWRGRLITQTSESTGARFFEMDNLPDLNPVHVETIQDFRRYKGKMIVK